LIVSWLPPYSNTVPSVWNSPLVVVMTMILTLRWLYCADSRHVSSASFRLQGLQRVY